MKIFRFALVPGSVVVVAIFVSSLQAQDARKTSKADRRFAIGNPQMATTCLADEVARERA